MSSLSDENGPARSRLKPLSKAYLKGHADCNPGKGKHDGHAGWCAKCGVEMTSVQAKRDACPL